MSKYGEVAKTQMILVFDDPDIGPHIRLEHDHPSMPPLRLVFDKLESTDIAAWAMLIHSIPVSEVLRTIEKFK